MKQYHAVSLIEHPGHPDQKVHGHRLSTKPGGAGDDDMGERSWRSRSERKSKTVSPGMRGYPRGKGVEVYYGKKGEPTTAVGFGGGPGRPHRNVTPSSLARLEKHKRYDIDKWGVRAGYNAKVVGFAATHPPSAVVLKNRGSGERYSNKDRINPYRVGPSSAKGPGRSRVSGMTVGGGPRTRTVTVDRTTVNKRGIRKSAGGRTYSKMSKFSVARAFKVGAKKNYDTYRPGVND